MSISAEPAVTSSDTRGPTVDHGRQYLDWVAPANCALAATAAAESAAIGPDGEFAADEWDTLRPELNAAYGSYADALDEMLRTGSRLTWPDELADEIEALLGEIGEEAEIARLLADASTLAEWNTGIERYARVEHAAAAAVRARLGLAPDDGHDRAC